jgi:hypothetical protein
MPVSRLLSVKLKYFYESQPRSLKHSLDIPVGTNCSPLPAELFYIHMKQKWFRKCYLIKIKKLAVSFKHTYRYINDILSIKDNKYHNYAHLIYPDKLEIKDTTESNLSSLYMEITPNILTLMTNRQLQYMTRVMT